MELWFWLHWAASISGFVVGGVFLKRYADFCQSYDLAISLVAYLLANLAFVQILKSGLGLGMALSSMGQLCIMVLIGAFVFGERVGPMQGVGVMLAVLAIAAFSYGAEVR